MLQVRKVRLREMKYLSPSHTVSDSQKCGRNQDLMDLAHALIYLFKIKAKFTFSEVHMSYVYSLMNFDTYTHLLNHWTYQHLEHCHCPSSSLLPFPYRPSHSGLGLPVLERYGYWTLDYVCLSLFYLMYDFGYIVIPIIFWTHWFLFAEKYFIT